MAKDLNKVMITGRLGRDPELRYTQSGDAVATFSVASDRAIRDEKEPSGFRDQTEWFRVVAWREMAERMTKVLVKGSRVYVEGRLQTQEYTDKQGQKQRSTEVVASDFIRLDSKNGQQQQGNAAEDAEEDWETGEEAYYPTSESPQQPETAEEQKQVRRRGYAKLEEVLGPTQVGTTAPTSASSKLYSKARQR